MSTNALPQQQSLPGADPAVVREKLLDLLDEYGDRVNDAQSGAEVASLIREYARACLAALEGLPGAHAEREREAYQLMLDQVEG